MKKRIVSAILAVCMLLSCIVAADYAVSATTTDAAKATEYKGESNLFFPITP